MYSLPNGWDIKLQGLTGVQPRGKSLVITYEGNRRLVVGLRSREEVDQQGAALLQAAEEFKNDTEKGIKSSYED